MAYFTIKPYMKANNSSRRWLM